MTAYPEWIYYPTHVRPPEWVPPFLAVVAGAQPTIDSHSVESLTSDLVLAQLRPGHHLRRTPTGGEEAETANHGSEPGIRVFASPCGAGGTGSERARSATLPGDLPPGATRTGSRRVAPSLPCAIAVRRLQFVHHPEGG